MSGLIGGNPLSRRQWEVGRDEENGDKLYVANTGEAPLVVNGTRVAKTVRTYVEVGDVLVIPGHYAFVVGLRPDKFDLEHAYPTSYRFGDADPFGIVGESYAIWQVRARIAKAAVEGIHVLVLGDTGAGKEMVSRAIYRLSDRVNRPFVSRNVTTLSAGVFDPEVWGCAANFPNAGSPERIGLIGEARDGYLMLDEIGGLTPELQRKLLRFLDAGEYCRVGESRTRVSSALLIAATNFAVERLENDFGRRFATKIRVPTLAERREDIPLVARHLVLKMAATGRGGAKRFVYQGKDGRLEVRMSCDFVTWLVRRDYAGNIRELEEILREAMFASGGDTIELEEEVAAGEAAAVQTRDRRRNRRLDPHAPDSPRCSSSVAGIRPRRVSCSGSVAIA